MLLLCYHVSRLFTTAEVLDECSARRGNSLDVINNNKKDINLDGRDLEIIQSYNILCKTVM